MREKETVVKIYNEENRLKVIQLLTDAGIIVWNGSSLFTENFMGLLIFGPNQNYCVLSYDKSDRTEITLKQLEKILNPNPEIKKTNLTVEELKLHAEKLGYDIFKKKNEAQVGNFGKFWDDSDPTKATFNFLSAIIGKKHLKYVDRKLSPWDNFCNLTQEEKEKITQNW